MKRSIPFLFILLTTSLQALAQPGSPSLNPQPMGEPDWGYVAKAAGDSCGAYFNNYIGLTKTSGVLLEPMRTGDIVEDYYYAGRAQRFTVSQPTEVSGVEFYAYETSPLDSVMVITSLHPYLSANDSVGAEITRDTVYVKHTTFSIILPYISVKSYFDAPVTMTSDFVIAMHTTLDVELWIVTNDYTNNDGNGEGNSWALYQNPVYPADDGWYSSLYYNLYDVDYLMSPLVKYDLFEPFSILDDTICPDVVNAGCVTYTPTGNFTNHMYNEYSSTSSQHIRWLWGDGYQNVDLLSACHTYGNAGTFDINLRDTLARFDFDSPYCIVDVTQPIVALGPPTANISFTQDGLTADFMNVSTNSDSVWWDFGDGTAGTDTDNPSHSYGTVGTFTVWLHAYNDCDEDSISIVVTTDDVGIDTKDQQFKIYPNPANNQVTISDLSGDAKIELYNLLGESVYTIKTSNEQETILLTNLPTGAYFVKITQGDFQTTRKLIVKH